MNSTPARSRWQFGVKHLLALAAFVAVATSVTALVAERLRFAEAEIVVEKICEPNVPPGIEFKTTYDGGFSHSAVPIPSTPEPIDWTPMVGARYKFRYRGWRTLWIPAENPSMIAWRRVEEEANRFAASQAARKGG